MSLTLILIGIKFNILASGVEPERSEGEMELVLKVKKVKRGLTQGGSPYIMIGYGDGITGFVPRDDFDRFEGVQRGDYVETEVFNFQDSGGIKFIPRCVVESS